MKTAGIEKRVIFELTINPKEVDLGTASFILRHLLAKNATDSGIGCRFKPISEDRMVLTILDVYAVENLGFFKKCLHFFRKGLTTVLPNIPLIIIRKKRLSLMFQTFRGMRFTSKKAVPQPFDIMDLM